MDFTTSMSTFKRYATVAYDRRNSSIISIESISEPERELLTADSFFSVFTTVLNPPNPSSVDNQASITLITALGFILRLYKDFFPSDEESPLTLLRGFLAVPIQFSTIGQEKVSLTSLPDDLQTTAEAASVTFRAIAKPWTVYVFIASIIVMVILMTALLLWILLSDTVYAEPSPFRDVDTSSKPMPYSYTQNSNYTSPENYITDYSTLLKRRGLCNADTNAIMQRIKSDRIRLVEMYDDFLGQNTMVLIGGRDVRDIDGIASLRRRVPYI
jgi:hypothetical protein